MLPTIAAAAVALALARRWLTRLSNAQPSPSPASPVPPTTDIPPTTEADAVSQQMPPTTSPHPTIAPPPRSTTLVRAAVNASAIAWPPVQASTPSMPRTGEEPPPLSDESQERLVGKLANEALAHRVIMDASFQLSKGHAAQASGKQVHAQVEVAMKRAYWDMLREQSAAGDYKMMLDNLREVKERLRAFLPISRRDMHAALEANFDVAFLEQQLTHRAFDGHTLATLLDTALGTIEQLEAPYRNHTTRAWLAETQQRINTHPAGWESLLPGIFDFVHDKLEEMGLDVLNWHLRSIAPWLAQHGVEYERANFTRLLAAQQMGLSATRRWAESTMAAVAAGEQQQQQPGTPWLLSAADHALCTAPPASSAGDTLAAGTREFVLARYGVLCLMCQPMALDRGSCPEVLWLDLPLLVETQNTLQAVTLIGALLMITTAHLRERGAAVGSDEVHRFKSDVLALLAHPMGSVKLLSDYMHQFVAQLRTDQGLPALTEEEKAFLGRMTDKTASTEDAFYRSMNKMVLSTLWQCVRAVDDTAAEAVLAGVRTAMKDEVAATCRALRGVVVHNQTVHEARLAQLFCTSLPPPPETASPATLPPPSA